MKLSTMRRVDAWLGRPLCFGLGLLARLRDRLVDPVRRPPEGRVLFIELSEMGSTILAAPSIQRVKERSGEPPCFVIFRKNVHSLRLLGLFDEDDIFEFPDSGLMAMGIGLIDFVRWCRRKRVRIAMDLELFARVSSILSVLSGARTRVGFDNYRAEGLYRGKHLTHAVNYNPYQHMARNFLALVSCLEDPRKEEPMPKRVLTEPRQAVSVPVIPELRDHVLGELRARTELHEGQRIVIVNPEAGAVLPIRNWPRERFAELVRRLLEAHPDVLVVLMGIPSGHDTIRDVARAVDDPRCVDFVGATRTLADVMQLFHLSELLLTNDSGPAHFATLTAIRTVTLFGPETEALYGPLGDLAINLREDVHCSPCLTAHNHRNSPCRDNVCLQQLSVERVLAACEAQLAASAAEAAGPEARTVAGSGTPAARRGDDGAA